jgi:hypothetical protein
MKSRLRTRLTLTAVFGAALAAPLTLGGLGTAAAAPQGASLASAPGLAAALDRAVPGDHVTVAAGVYASGTIRITRSGTAAAPIHVSAASVGAAVLTGGARVEFGAVSHVVLEGFVFNESAGIDVPPSAAAVRITRNTFNNVSGHNVVISADNSEVDHNAFQNKTSAGVYLQVNGPGSSGMAKNVHVHHNWFFNHTRRSDNGNESIRYGLSGRQHGDARGLIEFNLLEKADADSEAISVKSSNNVVRYNTILNSRGTLSLRHGWGTTVDGNYVIGGTSGIRFFGNNHTIVNNVVQDSTGQPLEVGGGEIRDDTGSTTAHEAADHCVVLFNTFVGTGTRVVRFGSDKAFDPSDINLSDNIFVGHGGNAVAGTGARVVYGGNILFGSARGTMPASGFRAVDPKLARGTGTLFRLSTGSPAVNAATGSFPQVTLDMDQVARTGTKDVGADELGGAQRRPLTRADVGPTAP